MPDLTDPQPWDPDSDDDGDCKIPPAENYHVLKAERDALRKRVEGLVEALTALVQAHIGPKVAGGDGETRVVGYPTAAQINFAVAELRAAQEPKR